MTTDINAVKQLREETGAGMMDCKKALEDARGDLEQARKILREKGLAGAQKRMGRVAREGVIGSYLHKQFGRDVVGVLVELNCETDFVAKSEEFIKLSKEIAMHVAAAKPRWLDRSEVPPDVIRQERELAEKSARDQGKPDHVIDKIVDGKLNAFYKEFCLVDQPYVRDDSRTVGELIAELGAKVGENVRVSRFVRFAVGEEV
ncbi:MAG: elongation factor Ts [Acidimicrobiia bacterium]